VIIWILAHATLTEFELTGACLIAASLLYLVQTSQYRKIA